MAKEQRLVVNSFAELKDFILNPLHFCAINITGNSVDEISIEQCQALAEALKLHNGRITLIKIANVSINDDGAIMICEALASRRVPSDYHPSILDFRHNYLTDDSVSTLKSLGSKVKILHLDNNYFSDGALRFKGSILANEFDYVKLNNNYIKTTDSITKFSCFSDYISCRNQRLMEISDDGLEVIGEVTGE